MNFGWVYPEDSGEYVCRATNLYGMDETRGIIKTAGKPGIIYESQLPRGMESIEKIRKLESGWNNAHELIEVENERFKPCFVTKPESQTACEGDTARFCCRVTGYPKPRVMWLLNGHTVINVSIIGGFYIHENLKSLIDKINKQQSLNRHDFTQCSDISGK